MVVAVREEREREEEEEEEEDEEETAGTREGWRKEEEDDGYAGIAPPCCALVLPAYDVAALAAAGSNLVHAYARWSLSPHMSHSRDADMAARSTGRGGEKRSSPNAATTLSTPLAIASMPAALFL